MLREAIFVADCPSCGVVGAHMYLCGKDVWCSRCHTEVGEERRRRHGRNCSTRAENAGRRG